MSSIESFGDLLFPGIFLSIVQVVKVFGTILTDDHNDDEILVGVLVSMEKQALLLASSVVVARNHVAERMCFVEVNVLSTFHVACLKSVEPGGWRCYAVHNNHG